MTTEGILVRVAEIGTKIYNGERKWIDARELSKSLDRISLVIAGFRASPNRSSEESEEARYLGLFDFDVEHEGLPTEALAEKVKLTIQESKTLGALFNAHEGYRALHEKVVTNACRRLEEKGIEHLCYFSGCKGYRLLVRHEALWCSVPREHRGPNRDFYEGHLRRWLIKYLDWSEEAANGLLGSADFNIHDPNKGVKPDMGLHPLTKLFPVPVRPSQDPFECVLAVPQANSTLQSEIRAFWDWVASTAPQALAEKGYPGDFLFFNLSAVLGCACSGFFSLPQHRTLPVLQVSPNDCWIAGALGSRATSV